MKKILLTDRAWPDSEIERRILEPLGATIVEAPAHDEATLVRLAGDCKAIGTCWAPVTEAVVRAATGCRIIARFGIGLDNISVATASELGIPVTNVPDYCVDEVAEHTLALLLALARNVGFFHHRTKCGEYDLQSGPTMHRLAGRTLGLVGLGRIGRAVCRRAAALGLNVIATTLSGGDHGTGCRVVPLDELLGAADFVSLHLPLTEASRGLLGEREFSLMKRSAFLINTSRGGLIDHEALRQALQAGRLAGAALDVFEPEPPDLSHPLCRDERMIATPHAAFLSAESLVDLRTRAAGQIATALRGERPANVVNPEVV